MRIEDLRGIGKTLLENIPVLAHSAESKKALGKGAAGDKSFAVDRRAEEIIFSGLAALKEPLTILSEEAGLLEIQGGGLRVIIDPVDGSRNAISGIPLYSTSIAAASGDTIGDVELSYVINLISGDEFWAERDKGAFLNGGRIRCQTQDELSMVLYEAQSPARDIQRIMPLLSHSRKARCLGSTALDMAYVSLGAVSVFVTPSPSRSFDFAGGWLLIKEAGGIVTDTEGEKIDRVRLGLERSSTLLASANQRLHEQALRLLAKRDGSE